MYDWKSSLVNCGQAGTCVSGARRCQSAAHGYKVHLRQGNACREQDAAVSESGARVQVGSHVEALSVVGEDVLFLGQQGLGAVEERWVVASGGDEGAHGSPARTKTGWIRRGQGPRGWKTIYSPANSCCTEGFKLSTTLGVDLLSLSYVSQARKLRWEEAWVWVQGSREA